VVLFLPGGSARSHVVEEAAESDTAGSDPGGLRSGETVRS
jgi:hypothetical protein